jgi:ABC-type glycerol-3-phosphate transport system permease component
LSQGMLPSVAVLIPFLLFMKFAHLLDILLVIILAHSTSNPPSSTYLMMDFS